PRTAQTSARPMPVLPLVGSMIVAPGFNRPSFSAASIIARQIRSLMLPPGLNDSSFAHTSPQPSGTTRFSRTTGVAEIRSRGESATNAVDAMKAAMMPRSEWGVNVNRPVEGAKRTLVIFPGALGDFLLLAPAIATLARAGGAHVELSVARAL